MVLGVLAGAYPGMAGKLLQEPTVAEPILTLLASAVGLGVGGGVTWGVRVLGAALFRKEAMGFGDVKLMAMIGAFLGWQAALLSFFLGCVFGAVVGVAVAMRRGMSLRIPFGPYLAMGAVVSLFAGERLIHLLFVEWPEWQQQHAESMWIVMLCGVGSLLLMFWLVRRSRR